MHKEKIMDDKIVNEGLTYDDVLLLPGFTDFKRTFMASLII